MKSAFVNLDTARALFGLAAAGGVLLGGALLCMRVRLALLYPNYFNSIKNNFSDWRFFSHERSMTFLKSDTFRQLEANDRMLARLHLAAKLGQLILVGSLLVFSILVAALGFR